MANAGAVSRVLKAAGLTKSESHATRIKGWRDYSSGFECRQGYGHEAESVHVEYITGSWNRNTEQNNQRADELFKNATTALEAKGYTVVRKDGRLVVTK